MKQETISLAITLSSALAKIIKSKDSDLEAKGIYLEFANRLGVALYNEGFFDPNADSSYPIAIKIYDREVLVCTWQGTLDGFDFKLLPLYS